MKNSLDMNDVKELIASLVKFNDVKESLTAEEQITLGDELAQYGLSIPSSENLFTLEKAIKSGLSMYGSKRAENTSSVFQTAYNTLSSCILFPTAGNELDLIRALKKLPKDPKKLSTIYQKEKLYKLLEHFYESTKSVRLNVDNAWDVAKYISLAVFFSKNGKVHALCEVQVDYEEKVEYYFDGYLISWIKEDVHDTKGLNIDLFNRVSRYVAQVSNHRASTRISMKVDKW